MLVELDELLVLEVLDAASDHLGVVVLVASTHQHRDWDLLLETL